MHPKSIAVMTCSFLSIAALIALFGLLNDWGRNVHMVLAAPGDVITPTLTMMDPTSTYNDVDTPIVISGTNLTAELSGTQVLTAPSAYLGSTALENVTWVDTTTLNAVIPWGMVPGAYTLTVVNPDGGSAALLNACTIANGIGVWTTNGPYGGQVGQVTLHPKKPDTVFAQGSDVGLFISDDAGGHWDMAVRLPRYHVDITFDAQDANVLYVWDEHGLSRSLDGTQSWEDLAIRTGGWWKHVPVAHPTLPGVVLAAVGSWRYPEQVGGVFRSDDYGANWITLTVSSTDTHFTSLAIHPTFTQTMLAGTESGNIFYSLDGGQNWTWATQISNTVAGLYFNPLGALQAWATTDGGSGHAPLLYRSENLSAWTSITVDAGLSDGNGFGWDLDFTSGRVWATTSGTYFSTDGGDNWTRLDATGVCGPGLWLAINPEDPQVVYNTPSMQGVCRSQDGGLTWQQVNEGLAAIVPAEIAVAPGAPDTVYVRAGGLDLAKSESGGQAWRVLDIGLGGGPHVGLAVDPFIPERVYASNLFSTDGGETWHPFTFTLPITWNGGELLGVSSIAPHPAVPGRILAGVAVSQGDTHVGLLYASDDHGEHWNWTGPSQSMSWINSIAYDAADPGLNYVATWSSGLWISADEGQTWETSIPLEGFTEIHQAFTHPDRPSTVYAFVRQLPHGEFKFLISQDAGETWTILPDGASAPFYFAPTRPALLYAPCNYDNLTLCRSWDGGSTWEAVSAVQQEIVALSGGTDGERIVIYVGTKGGQVSTTPGALAQSAAPFGSIPGRGNLLGSGVYRLTTLLPNHWVFLPLAAKAFAP